MDKSTKLMKQTFPTRLRAKWLKCSYCSGRMGQRFKVFSQENKSVQIFSLHFAHVSQARFLVALSWIPELLLAYKVSPSACGRRGRNTDKYRICTGITLLISA